MTRLTCLLLATVALLPGGTPAWAQIDFNRDVRPLLSDNCFFCHGPDASRRKAGLRLDTLVGATADLGEGGQAAVVPGSAEKSLLVERIFASDPDERMPPPDSGKELTPAERRILQEWIEDGAPWAEHWAYVAPKLHPLPEVAEDRWPRNAVDPYIVARLEKEGLQPSPDADPSTLLRRVCFDLTGLPPSPEATLTFLRDPSEEAYEKVVDDLLDSPHYGERMAIYWLDLVRYADTVGYHGDQDHHISPYRDYIITAFNENMRFDRFTREQLAGDLLRESDVDEKVATGYNRLLQTSHEGGVQPKEYLAIYAADRVRNVSAVWMGATLGCAQCHDHKYDPFTIRDFYSMAAFFADIDEERHFSEGSNDLPTRRPPEMKVLGKDDRMALRRVEADLAESERALRDLKEGGGGESRALEEQLRGLLLEREGIQAGARLTMVTQALDQPRVTRVLPRGNWLDETGPVVQPGVPSFLGRLQTGTRRATRLDLAKWLTDGNAASGQLTARVFVNRLWYLMFGSGLSKSLEDFGGQGEPPVHPELLDHLALVFVQSGWDVKGMVRMLVTSRAYRQSSVASERAREIDPENRLFARQTRMRLPAEMIRDAALSMSGLLDRSIGGPSVKPYQPEGYYRHLNFPPRRYRHHEDGRQWRRGVYVHWQRQFLHPMLKAFDAPSREECAAARPRSNTPTAALTLLNDPTFVEAARVLAERLLREEPDDPAKRLDRAFHIVLSRPPDEAERRLLEELCAEEASSYREHPDEARALIEVGEAPRAVGLDPVELASWSAVARALLNLDETITRR